MATPQQVPGIAAYPPGETRVGSVSAPYPSGFPGMYPIAGQIPPFQFPHGQFPPDHFPPGQFPPGQFPPGQFPPGQIPPDQFPPGQFPPGQIPPGQFPPGQFPPGQFPPGQIPPGQFPPGQIPPGQFSPDQPLPGQVTPGQFTGSEIPQLSTDYQQYGHYMEHYLPQQLPHLQPVAFTQPYVPGVTSLSERSSKLSSICSEKKKKKADQPPAEQKITVIHKVKCKCRCKGTKSQPAKTVQVEEYVDRPPCAHEFCILERVKETCPEAAELLKCPFPQAVPKQKPCVCCCKPKRKRRSKCMTREEFATIAEYAAKREAAVSTAQELIGFFNVMLLVADVIRERKAQKRAEKKKDEKGAVADKEKPDKKDEIPDKKDEIPDKKDEIPEKTKRHDKNVQPKPDEKQPIKQEDEMPEIHNQSIPSELSTVSEDSSGMQQQELVSIPEPEVGSYEPSEQQEISLEPPDELLPADDEAEQVSPEQQVQQEQT